MALPGYSAETSISVPGTRRGDWGLAAYSITRNHVGEITSEAGGATPAAISIPVYGNHCGPGYGDPNVPPVDLIDAACYRHDRCYEQRGYLECGCNRQLITEIGTALPLTLDPVAHTAGVTIMSFFQNTPCLCYPRVCFIGFCVPLPPVPGFGGIGPC